MLSTGIIWIIKTPDTATIPADARGAFYLPPAANRAETVAIALRKHLLKI